MTSFTRSPSMVLRMIVLTIVLAVAHCEIQNETEPVKSATRHRRIAKGYPTDRRYYPYIVSIQSRPGYHICAGTIISEKVVLTAGHCASHRTQFLCVMVGEPYRNDYPNKYYYVDDVFQHEHYDLPGNLADAINDISLLTLQKPIQPSEIAQKVTLIGRNQWVPVGTPAVALGWGAVREPQIEDLQPEKPLMAGEENNPLEVSRYRFDNGTYVLAKIFPKNLQHICTTVISKDECLKRYEDPVDKSHMCTFSPGSGHCFKDSGGPLMVNGIQVGVYSGGKRCGSYPGYPNLYTDLRLFRDWIDEKMRSFGGNSSNPIKNPIETEKPPPKNIPSFNPGLYWLWQYPPFLRNSTFHQ